MNFDCYGVLYLKKIEQSADDTFFKQFDNYQSTYSKIFLLNLFFPSYYIQNIRKCLRKLATNKIDLSLYRM